eukprot:577821-Pyramimonas_sp.AAC.1
MAVQPVDSSRGREVKPWSLSWRLALRRRRVVGSSRARPGGRRRLPVGRGRATSFGLWLWQGRRQFAPVGEQDHQVGEHPGDC